MAMKNTDQLTKFRHQAEMLSNKVVKRFRHLRKGFARDNIEAFRLYDWDIPEIRAVVDWYAGHLVIGEYTRRQSDPEWLPEMGVAVAAKMGVPPENVHLKKRYYGLANGQRYERLDITNRMLVVSERDLKFYVNPWDYVDTGLFADHRITRRMVREAAADKIFLNLFCYSGSFSCYAALGGARESISVDRSRTAIEWTRRNMDLNGIAGDRHRTIQAHAFDFLDTAKQQGRRFDLAVVDPPSFYTRSSRGDHFDIAADHPRLLAAVTERMHPGGLIFFSTNHQDFTSRLDELKVLEVKEITSETIPEDYRRQRNPVHRCWRIKV